MKSLWNGLSGGLPVEPDVEANHEEQAEPVMAMHSPEPAAEGKEKVGLAQVEEAMAGGEELRALTVVRDLLLSGQLAPSTLEVTGRLMNRLGEGELAQLFGRASREEGAEALLELAGTFLRMGDAAMALSMARGAGRRTAADLTVVHGLIAEAHARCGDHDAVLELLGRYESVWPDPALYRRFATSAVLAGDLSEWGMVQEAIRKDGESDWLLRAAERVAAYGAQGGSSHRSAYFNLSGGCLVLEGPPVRDRALTMGELRCIVEGARRALKEAGATFERVAYVSPRGEVFAHWLGELLGVIPIPLSGRIDGQSTLVVAADEDDMKTLLVHPRFSGEPLPVFQVLKPLRQVGGVCSEVVGVFAENGGLPLDDLTAERTSDRLPPRLLLARIQGAVDVADSALMENVAGWVAVRRTGLSLLEPPALRDRIRYQGDLPTWAPLELEVAETEVAEAEVAEAEVAEAEVAETEVAETEVAETEVAETEVAETEVAEAEVAETADDAEGLAVGQGELPLD